MPIRVNFSSFKEFFRSGSIGGVILILCVIISLWMANSPLGEEFSQLLSLQVGIGNEQYGFYFPLIKWINDGLMAIFFLLIGLEIKRELVEGELSSYKKAAMPVFAAFGGAIVPALIFYFLNKGSATASGWGIPMATDIAFALSVLALLGKRVPVTLKIFLAALAIADDLIAILVIAIFYSAKLHISSLFYAAAFFLLMMVFNRLKYRSLFLYLIPGMFIWYFIHHSGIHATIAGVITAFTLPTTTGRNESPLERLEHLLNKPVNFIIMPLFALANTNISFENANAEMLTGNLGLGIVIGLILGKPIGIGLLSWLSVKLKWSVLPKGAHWGHIVGLGVLGGIGFTMSIFISLLSFNDPSLQSASKIAVLAASAFSGITGYLILYFMKKKKRVTTSSQVPG